MDLGGGREAKPQRLKPHAKLPITARLKSCRSRSVVVGPRLSAELADDCGYVVFLEETDGGYAGCAGFEAGVGILQSYAAQGQDWDFCLAGLAQSFEACGRCVFFFEDWGEEG
jgi:hypothetical protein